MEGVVGIDGGYEGLMRVDGEGLGEDVGKIVGTFAPHDTESILFDAVMDPMEADVYGF